jgi:CTP synthase (UTP-ammonia lyase)
MPEYKSIHDGIFHKDIVSNNGYLFAEIGRFEFNSIYDNHFNSNQLAWFAGNETDEYIRQIELKLKPFFDKESTYLLIELNSLSKKQV